MRDPPDVRAGARFAGALLRAAVRSAAFCAACATIAVSLVPAGFLLLPLAALLAPPWFALVLARARDARRLHARTCGVC